MRFVALALVFLSLPLFLSLLRSYPQRRGWAFAVIAVVLFLGSAARTGGFIIAWPLWNGVSRGIGISITDMLALALVVTRRPLPGRLPFWGVFGLYGATLVFSVMLSAVKMASVFSVWQYGMALLLFWAVAGEIHRDEPRRGLLTGLALGLMFQAFYVVQQKAHGVVQATGTMSHQNVLGMMVEMAMLPLLAALLGGDNRKVVLAGLAAGLVIIAGGGSRGAIAFAGGGAAVLLIVSMIRGVTPVKARVAGLAVLALAVAAPLGYVTLKDRFGARSVTEKDDQRPAFERAALAMSADHPFGVGANMYVTTANVQHYAERAGVAWSFTNRANPVHNAYLLARAETGWAGEIAFIILLVVPMAQGLRAAFQQRRGMGGEAALGSAVALGVNIIHNNYEFAAFTGGVMTLLVINMGIIAAQIRASRHLAPRRAGPARPLGAAPQLTARPA